jgi:hypothetical protein
MPAPDSFARRRRRASPNRRIYPPCGDCPSTSKAFSLLARIGKLAKKKLIGGLNLNYHATAITIQTLEAFELLQIRWILIVERLNC